ncbi:hypothetical protein DV737_g751, partial [Chaetothyriales sp. CBS 132003]
MPTGALAVPYAEMLIDGPEIGTLIVVVDRAKNLPNRRTMGKQDPYCAMRLGKEAKKTTADRRGGQTPRWDQELRFTVRDSPDHYRLKCSVFNDDKKTDLIGESWIDLKALIVPGGGQNDLWHQLNFKGKYAGDIRIEMTYYDTRENVVAEAAKERRRAKGPASDTMSVTSSVRQLGPREVKRRPLPPNPDPGADVAVDSPPPLRIHRQLLPQPGVEQQQEQEEQLWQLQQHQPPPRPPQQEPHRYHHHNQPEVDNPYNPQPHEWSSPQAHDVFAIDVDHHAAAYNPYERQEDTISSLECYDDNSVQGQFPTDEYNSSPQGYSGHPRPILPDSYTESQLGWHHQHSSPPPPPHQMASSPHSSPHSSPPAHQSPPGLPDVPPRQHRMSASPTKYAPYRDSPLRQSITSHEVLPQLSHYHDPSADQDASAPPPPTHRIAMLSRSSSAQSALPQSQHTRQLPQPLTTVGDRGPLQMIEHHYQSQPQRALPTPPDRRPTVADASDDELIAGKFPAPNQLAQNFGVDFVTEPVEVDNSGRYIRRNSGLDDGPYQLLQRAHTFDTADVFDERNTYRSQPQVVKPRAVSPNAAHSVPRKSISPHPQAQAERSGMGTVPFSPDSYDVLIPDPSGGPTRNLSIKDEREVARQNEVDKLKDQGPIIGNDGRVIDPSDHLPSDTWAPEPERKQRQPEHVIRIRTRDEVRHSQPGSSPLSIMPTSASALSEYQLAPINSQGARGSYYPSHQQIAPTPTKALEMRLQSYVPPQEGYADPLAAEMSTIDIGPSRAKRISISGISARFSDMIKTNEDRGRSQPPGKRSRENTSPTKRKTLDPVAHSASSLGLLQEISHSASGRVKSYQKRASIPIFQDTVEESLPQYSPYASPTVYQDASSPACSQPASDSLRHSFTAMGLKEISGNARKSPAIETSAYSSGIARVTGRPASFHLSRFNPEQYIEHLEKHLELVKNDAYSPESNRPWKEKLKAADAEKERLKSEAQQMKAAFEAELQKTVAHMTATEVELRRKIWTMEDDLEQKSLTIRELEMQHEERRLDQRTVDTLRSTIDKLEHEKRSLEQCNDSIIKRNEPRPPTPPQGPASIFDDSKKSIITRYNDMGLPRALGNFCFSSSVDCSLQSLSLFS